MPYRRYKELRSEFTDFVRRGGEAYDFIIKKGLSSISRPSTTTIYRWQRIIKGKNARIKDMVGN